MRQPQARQQRLMAFEEIGIVLQIAGNGFFFGFDGGEAACFSCAHRFKAP